MAYIWLLFAIILYTNTGVHGVCFDPCERPTYCNDGDVTAIPGECQNYYFCEFRQWKAQSCAPGSVFVVDRIDQNPHGCQCELETGNNTCPYTCTTIPPTTLPPGPCDDVPIPCDEGVKYADQSNCTFYYICTDGALEQRVCDFGSDHGLCNVTGLPCAFDINLSQCVHPDRDFDCETRCPSQDTSPIDLVDNEIEASFKLQVLDKEWDKLMKKQQIERKDLEKDIAEESTLLKKIYGTKPLSKYQLQRKREILAKLKGKKNKLKANTCLNPSLACNKPPYCAEGDMIGHGNDCHYYFQCVYGSWSAVLCNDNYEFNMNDCTCVPPGTSPTCFDCPQTTAAPTPTGGPCLPIEECTFDGRRVSDSLNCEDYYECVGGEWEHRDCIAGITHDCTTTGYACAFDTETNKCIHPDSTFSCDNRCEISQNPENEVKIDDTGKQ